MLVGRIQLAGQARWASGLSAGLICLALVGLPLGGVADAADAPVKVSETASRHFSQGVRYLTSQDPERYEKAYREFKAAYADSPSWKILGNLGIVAHELERDGEAIDAFEAYLARGGKELSSDERKQFKEDLEVTQAGVATVALEVNEHGVWILDERLPETGAPIVNRYGPTDGTLELRVRAGHHRIRAERNGYESDVWEFSNAPGESASHSFDLRPEGQARQEVRDEDIPVEPTPDARVDSSSDGSGLRVVSYVSLGLGAVGLGLGTYFLIDGYSKREHADELFSACSAVTPNCPEGSPQFPQAKAAEDAEGDAFDRSLIGFVAGGALVATGVVLWLVSAPSQEGGSDEAFVMPWVSPSGAGLAGRF